ncbi:glutamyl-tRNA amidotransferase [Rhodobacteraceae bacterium WD3A24]|nr:glutamyl-tRNA amidotransferase [Rhodobacteraceae bacterium WD3A24]
MPLRERISAALKDALRRKEPHRLSTLRLINAAIKDRDIARRGSGEDGGVSEAEMLTILGRMIRQRQESARAYEEGGRLELAEQERDEIAVIEEFLPRQLSEEETRRAVDAAIADAGAASIRDMGRVMALLKERHAGRMDFAAVGPMVKERLS